LSTSTNCLTLVSTTKATAKTLCPKSIQKKPKWSRSLSKNTKTWPLSKKC
jgi:hypothetical protein